MPTKAHRLRIPTPRTSELYAVIMALGILAAWTVIYGGAVLILMQRAGYPADPPQWIYTLSITAGLIGPIALAILVERSRHARRMRPTRLRTERLDRLAASPASRDRLHHRHIEGVLRRVHAGRRAIERELVRLPPRSIILVTAREFVPRKVPCDSTVPFEPIDIADNSNHVFDLVDLFFSDVAAFVEPARATAADSVNPPAQGLFSGTSRQWAACAAVMIPFLAFVFYQTIGSFDRFEFVALLVCLSFVASQAPRCLIFERRWWLVPGGLLYREDRIWRKSLRWGVIRANESPLMIDMRSGIARVVERGRVRRVRCAEIARWFVVAGWASAAPSPTDEQVRSFLGVAPSSGEVAAPR